MTDHPHSLAGEIRDIHHRVLAEMTALTDFADAEDAAGRTGAPARGHAATLAPFELALRKMVERADDATAMPSNLREVMALAICNSERGPNAEFHLGSFDDELAWSIGADLYRKKANAALSAIRAAGCLRFPIKAGDDLGGGLEAVPREPTEAMIEVGVAYRLRSSISGDNTWPIDTAELYRAMLAAAKEEGQ